MTARRPELAVPTHLQGFLNLCEGHWTLFDARYFHDPLLMPDDYEFHNRDTEKYPAVRFVVARLTSANVRAAIWAFSPREAGISEDRRCHKMAQRVLVRLNHLEPGEHALAS